MRKILKIILLLMLVVGLFFSVKSLLDDASSDQDNDIARELARGSGTAATAVITEAPTEKPTEVPTEKPTENPTEAPTEKPTEHPTEVPTEKPTEQPTEAPTEKPTEQPTEVPTEKPTEQPTEAPTEKPTEQPTEAPTEKPTEQPTEAPTEKPTEQPTEAPTEKPTEKPTEAPTPAPTQNPKASLVHSDPVVMELLAMDLDALREHNPEVVGWVYIPNTAIDYPMVQGADNDFYLKHTWMKEENNAGAIFLEAENSVDMSDFNTIIYGHNMRNGSMFSDLNKYQSRSYLLNHPYAYVLTDNGVYRYDLYATYKAGVRSITYAMKIQTEKKRNELISFIDNYSQLDMDVMPSVDDHLLTLSTCSGLGQPNRRVVIGIFNEEGSCLINPLK